MTPDMLQELENRLIRYQPETPVRGQGDEAAVLIAVTQSKRPRLLLTRRADGLSSHAGEVALPGGKRDRSDASLLDTALRETAEEVGLPPTEARIIGRLKSFESKFGLDVTPFVGLIPEDLPLVINRQELDALFYVPLSFLLGDPRSSTDRIVRRGEIYLAPVYIYQGHKIWGLTSRILVEFLNVGLDAGIPV
jgi:8-oxo-dGTP pyrophosphatase MutT (NUDIX family)